MTQPEGSVEHINPPGLFQSPAFSQVVTVTGPVRTVYVGGQNAVTAAGEMVGLGDMGAQTDQVMANVETALAAGGADLGHVVRWTVYLVQGQDLGAGFAAFQRAWGDRPDPPPLVTVAVVAGLAHPQALVEVEAMAVVPLPAGS
jgi:enamine deaminase RidA (YjgF/YER057c/UK114 family)